MAHPPASAPLPLATPASTITPTSVVSWRSLLALVAVVLLVHLFMLSSASSVWRVSRSTSTSASMTTRTLEAAPAPMVEPPKPVAPPLAKAPAPLPNIIRKPATAQSNIARAAIKTIVPSEPVIAPITIAEPPIALAEPAPPTPTPPITIMATPQPSSDDLLAQGNQPRNAAANPSQELVLRFPDSGKFGYSVIVQRGAQPQTGSGTLEWSTDGSSYHLQLEATALFITLLSQTSVGSLSADGLEPLRFSDKRFNRSEKATHFQRDKERITFSGNQNEAPLLRGAQDQLSVLMQLAALFAGNPKQFNEVGRLSMQVANTEDAETWQFNVENEEKLVLPAGETRTVHLVRNPRKEFDTRLEVWLAPAIGYLPVRIKQTNANGNSEDLQLRSPTFR